MWREMGRSEIVMEGGRSMNDPSSGVTETSKNDALVWARV